MDVIVSLNATYPPQLFAYINNIQIHRYNVRYVNIPIPIKLTKIDVKNKNT